MQFGFVFAADVFEAHRADIRADGKDCLAAPLHDHFRAGAADVDDGAVFAPQGAGKARFRFALAAENVYPHAAGIQDAGDEFRPVGGPAHGGRGEGENARARRPALFRKAAHCLG